jgi:cell division protein FtsQ
MLIILLLAVVLAGGGSIWLLYGSPWLRVESVSVTGTRVLTEAQVRQAADVPLGSPLISLDTDAIEARLRQKLPRIASVDVVSSWPHGIGLKVTERTPVLIVRNGGKFIEVDGEGVRFATVSQPPKAVPTLELAVSRSAGARRFGTDRLTREAVRVARAVPPAVARDTQVVKVRSYDSISLELSGGRTVLWGSGEKGRAKAVTLVALMKAAPHARHFDVSVPTAPASLGS